MTNPHRTTESEYMTKARCHMIPRQVRQGQVRLAEINARNGLIYAIDGEARAALVIAMIWAGLQ